MSWVRSWSVVGETVGGFVGGVELEVSVIVVELWEVLFSRSDLRRGSEEVSLAFLWLSFAGMQRWWKVVWKKFPWES
jgi:hypothetical protein